MKKLLPLLAVALMLTPGLKAQQRSQYMMITVYEDIELGGHSRMIKTMQDGSQEVMDLHWKIPYNFNRIATHEDSLMAELKPFFDQGWALVTAVTMPNSNNFINGAVLISRYFFRKEP
jgi:hypothetical protein